MNSVAPLQFGDLPAMRLRAPDGAEATVTLFGAHVVSWRPRGEDERIFCSTRSHLDGSKAIRGGIPVIFPQFAERGDGMRHGFARLSTWRLGASGLDGAACFAEFELGSDDTLPVPWPYQFGLTLRVEVEGAELRMQLTVRNTGTQAFAFSSALHTYLLVDDVGRITLDGLQQQAFEDQLQNGEQGAGQSELLRIPGAMDRIYYGVRNDLILAEGSRSTVLAQDGFSDVVVWNPGAETAATLSDLEPQEFRQFVCVEPAMIRSTRLEPGREWSGRYRLCADESIAASAKPGRS
jgi:glucose-6-phosphate 1-epimerase